MAKNLTDAELELILESKTKQELPEDLRQGLEREQTADDFLGRLVDEGDIPKSDAGIDAAYHALSGLGNDDIQQLASGFGNVSFTDERLERAAEDIGNLKPAAARDDGSSEPEREGR